jgi:hypothetical protein
MPDGQNTVGTPLDFSGAQNQIWLLGLGLFEEQLSTVAPNLTPEVNNQPSNESSWDTALCSFLCFVLTLGTSTALHSSLFL